MNRRHFLQSSFFTALATVLPAYAATGRKPRLLLRNGWQSQNIGDIAHYLGMMELLKWSVPLCIWTGNKESDRLGSCASARREWAPPKLVGAGRGRRRTAALFVEPQPTLLLR